MNELKADVKELLTKTDIETLKNKVADKFKSQLTEFTTDITKVPLKSADDFRALNSKLRLLSERAHNTIVLLDELNTLSLD